MLPELQQYQQHLRTFLSQTLKQQKKQLPQVPQKQEVFSRLEQFVKSGKLLRGSLILLFHHSLTKKKSLDAMKAAAALELLHSSLLIHDDIIDKDLTRRGKPTIPAQFQQVAKKEKLKDPQHFGVSFGICTADLGYFLAFNLLNSLSSEKIKKDLFKLYTEEFSSACLAEMQDVYLESTQTATKKQVLEMYAFKTARYTISLPLMASVLLANKPSLISSVEKIGIDIGLIFQIKDDEIGIKGTKAIGKPIGSDIAEGKKTLYLIYLLEQATRAEKSFLQKLRSTKISQRNITKVKELLEKYAIWQRIDHTVQQLTISAHKRINRLSVKKINKEVLHKILDYSLKRQK